MKLTPREVEKLGLHNAGYLAQKRLARGLKLNHTEAAALIASQILEFVRDGDRSVAELMDLGKQLLGRRQVLPAVPYLLDSVQVEGTFPDGTKLITIHDAIASENGNLELALHGSFLPVPPLEKFPWVVDNINPGDIIYGSSDPIAINSGRKAVILRVVNTGDRPIQVGSHYHFIEVNPSLVFDRWKAYGMRLNIAAGTATRFEPGDCKKVTLVKIGGNRVIRGGNGIADGPVDDAKFKEVMEAVKSRGFGNKEEENASEGVTGIESAFTTKISREKYATMYGPTTGDKILLGDTNLYAEIESDFAVYGDESVFGGGKVIRDGMGQSCGHPPTGSLDTVITNAVIIDYSGIIKADIGIKDGRIASIGKAGNPDIMDGVFSNMIIGVNTEVIAGEGMIVTAGAIDCHVHFICPQLAFEAISSGITTLVGGGTGPADGTRATTCTPAPSQMKLMLQSTDDLPLNFGFTGKGNSSTSIELHEIVKAGFSLTRLLEKVEEVWAMDLDMADCASEELSPASVSKKLKHNEDSLACEQGNSSGTAGSVSSINPLKSFTSDSNDMNNLNASSSDLSYHDDEDGEEAGDDADYFSEYDDYDNIAYNDEYTTLQSQFDHVDLPTGVEVLLPWLKDPTSSENISETKTLNISDLPESKKTEVAACSSNAHAASSSNNRVEETEDDVMQKFQHFKHFDVVDDFSDHHYSRMGFSDKQPPKNWAKRIQEEWKILENDLPDTIYVRVYEARMELLRAVIVGPSGTPYHDGLFVFDCLFPTEYPNSPPMVYYYSSGLRLNPNLYECGKVCLSLLGTWSGHNNENWVPGKSTMLQVLVSIQALILNAKPFFNEPGYDRTYTGADGESRSNKYNEDVFILSLKTMVYTLRRPPKHFEDLVAGHFRQRAHQILLSCKAYIEGALVGSNLNDGAGNQVVPDSSTTNFKVSLIRMMNTLVTSFTKNGSTDCEQYRLPG